MAQGRKREKTWRLIPRVQEIGFFYGVMATRQRLITVALSATAAELLVIYLVSTWMRATSGAPMSNVLIIALSLTGLLVAAYLDALVIGDLFFPGRWRERILAGGQLEPQDWEEEQAFVKEYNAPFFVIFFILLFGLYGLSQLLTNRFLAYYQDLGFALTLMRSDDPDDRLMGLEEMVNPLREQSWQNESLHAHIADLVDDDDPRVQAMAAYVAGRLDVVSAADGILEAFRHSDDDTVRADAAMALGRLEWEKSVAYTANALRSPDLSEAVALGILRGFSFSQDERAGSSVMVLLESCATKSPPQACSKEVVEAAFYALRKMKHEAGRSVAMSYLRSERELEERCAAADALRYIATGDDIPELQRAFSEVTPDDECAYAQWRYHEEKAIDVTEKEPLRAKLLRAIGNRKIFETYEWIWAVGADEKENDTTRKVAEQYAREMLAAYETRKH